MKVLHICSISNSPFNGMGVVIPQHIEAQSSLCEVYVLNIYGGTVLGGAKHVDVEDILKKRISVDIVVFHGVYFLKYLKIAQFLKRNGIPYIIVPHCSLTKISLKQKRLKKIFALFFLFSRFLKNATAIQFLTKNEMESSIYSSKGFVCGNGVPIVEKQKKWDTVNEIKNFVYIGRFDVFQKGIDLLFDAIEQEKDFLTTNGFLLNMYGPNHKDAKKNGLDVHNLLKNMAVSRGIESLVSINDAVVGEKKIEVLLENDCFIQTSRFEGLPTGVLEALSVGLPCLVTDGTNTAEIINEYNAGWGVKNSPKEITKAIKHAVSEGANRIKQKSKNASKLINDNYTWEKIAKKEIFAYKEFLKISKEQSI